ncbi:MAG TPA: hypothetical protein VGL72_05770 [Bryobacteraceae bacterium]|jgi:hypothetical protein
MHQALHIFRKDLRYLSVETASLVLLTLMFPGFRSRYFFSVDLTLAYEFLIVMASGYLIACLIQAESIPGTNQFWITRPYLWRSLLAAKLAYILLFVNVPILIVQIAILATEKFPIASNWQGLLATQMLFLIALELPLTALAALTRGLVGFVSSVLTLALLVMGGSALNQIPVSFAWIRSSMILMGALLIAIPVLILQYRGRRTVRNRYLSLAAACLTVAALVLTPWSSLFAVQSRISKVPVDVKLDLDPDWKLELFSEPGRELELTLPVRLSELPPGMRLQFEEFSVTLRNAAGRELRMSEGRLTEELLSGSHFGIRGHAPMDAAFFADAPNQPLTLRASFYLTILGNSHSIAMTAPDVPAPISDGMQCAATSSDDMVFRAAFRLPARYIEVLNPPATTVSDSQRAPVDHPVSYSPFPAGLRINPIAVSQPYFLIPGHPVAHIVISEPLAYVRRDLEVSGLHLIAR